MTTTGTDETGQPPEAQPELIVVLTSDAVAPSGVDPAVEQALRQVVRAAAPHAGPRNAVTFFRLFDTDDAGPPDAAAAYAFDPAGVGPFIAPLGAYLAVQGVTGSDEELAAALRSLDTVAGAYLKPPAALPTVLNTMAPSAEDPPATTPDFSGMQVYLTAPPGGVGAVQVSNQPGGRGAGVSVVDVEGAWQLTHEDLRREDAVLAGTPSDQLSWRNHGTAVLGVLASRANAVGTTGIAPDARVRAVPIFGAAMSSAAAIRRAADALKAGDILMVELHRPGPRAGLFGQQGYIPVEWWPDDFDAISYAVQRGVIVVAAGGNGSQNLDDPIYDRPLTGFPPGWRNPFQRTGRDSGSVLVGAGAPPASRTGSPWGPDRSRLDFSNYGAAIDVQGHGRDVVTCGYGDLQSGPETRWYTSQFSGTSSALPIVVGALACAQGILAASSDILLTPGTTRRALRATGSPQQAGPGGPVTERIGSRPDIPALVRWVRTESAGGGTTGGKDSEAGPRKFPQLEKNQFKDMLEAARPPDASTAPALDQRVRALEGAVAELRHFITADRRPDLSVPAGTPGPAEESPKETPSAADLTPAKRRTRSPRKRG